MVFWLVVVLYHLFNSISKSFWSLDDRGIYCLFYYNNNKRGHKRSFAVINEFINHCKRFFDKIAICAQEFVLEFGH